MEREKGTAKVWLTYLKVVPRFCLEWQDVHLHLLL